MTPIRQITAHKRTNADGPIDVYEDEGSGYTLYRVHAGPQVHDLFMGKRMMTVEHLLAIVEDQLKVRSEGNAANEAEAEAYPKIRDILVALQASSLKSLSEQTKGSDP